MFLYKNFQSQSCLLESTAAIFRQSAGYVFVRNDFLNSLIVRSRSSFCLVNENSLNCTSALVLLFFILSSKNVFCFT